MNIDELTRGEQIHIKISFPTSAMLNIDEAQFGFLKGKECTDSVSAL